MRIDYGPGYRVYYQRRGPIIALRLCGGDKRTEGADIKRALQSRKTGKGEVWQPNVGGKRPSLGGMLPIT